MSLNQFMNKINNKRVNNQLKVVERYADKYINSNIIILIHDTGLQFKDVTRDILILDLNVIQ